MACYLPEKSTTARYRVRVRIDAKSKTTFCTNEVIGLASIMPTNQKVLLTSGLALLLGSLGGYFFAREKGRLDVLVGPYSDNYPPALTAIAQAKAKVQSGNIDVLEELNTVQYHIERAQKWAKAYLGDKEHPPAAIDSLRPE